LIRTDVTFVFVLYLSKKTNPFKEIRNFNCLFNLYFAGLQRRDWFRQLRYRKRSSSCHFTLRAQKVYFCFISTKNISQCGLDQSSFRSILHQGGGFTVEKESIIKKCREFGQEIIFLNAKSILPRPKTETK
jgi:hypothetical protein